MKRPKKHAGEFSDPALEHAERDGLHLVYLSLDGHYAKKGRWEVAVQVGPETLARLNEFLFNVLMNDKERLK